jgi:hypothetical protein
MNPADVFFAVPTRGHVNVNTVLSLLALQERSPTILFHVEAGAMSVSDVRHRIVQRFLASDRAWCFMADDDVAFNPTVLQLMSGGFDIAGAPYFIIRHEYPLPIPSAYSWSESQQGFYPYQGNPYTQRGWHAVDGVATGCIAIKRAVFESPAMRRPFEMGYNADGILVRTDDLQFCRRAKEAGFTIGCNFDLRPDHLPTSVSLNGLHVMYSRALQRAGEKPDRRILTPEEVGARG